MHPPLNQCTQTALPRQPIDEAKKSPDNERKIMNNVPATSYLFCKALSENEKTKIFEPYNDIKIINIGVYVNKKAGVVVNSNDDYRLG